MVTLTDLQTRREGLSASAKLLVLKMFLSLYLCRESSDFDEILCGAAHFDFDSDYSRVMKSM